MAATALAVIPGGTANAAPTPAEIERTAKDLGGKLDATNEQYNNANVLLKQSRAKQVELAAKVKTFEVQTDAYEKRVGAIGASAYRGGRPSALNVVLGGGSPDTVLQQLAVLDVVTRDQRGSIDELLKARKPLDDAKRKLDKEVAAQAFQEQTLREKKATLTKDLAKWEALRAQLGARASRSAGRSAPPVYDGPASGRGATVMKYAYAQIGDPYVFGASGPNSFDCSGLTMAAWSQVGVSMPHSAKQQYAKFPKVSKANLQPGDIVFFYSPISHNGLYAGNGMVVHAPQPGESVEKISLSAMPFSGAARPS